jgi:hypothetical protein
MHNYEVRKRIWEIKYGVRRRAMKSGKKRRR